jgi:hypothetical protein
MSQTIEILIALSRAEPLTSKDDGAGTTLQLATRQRRFRKVKRPYHSAEEGSIHGTEIRHTERLYVVTIELGKERTVVTTCKTITSTVKPLRLGNTRIGIPSGVGI